MAILSSAVKKKETSQEKFIRLANARVNTALRKIRLVANLSGGSYTSTEGQRAKIIQALVEEVKKVQASFAGTTRTDDKFSV